MDNRKWALGVDVGGTSTKFGFVNERGEIIRAGKPLNTRRFMKPDSFVNALFEELYPVIEDIKIENLQGIGIGAPNGNFYNGCIEYAPNLPWKGQIPLAELVAAKFQLPCKLTNDANAAAAGERMYGVAKGMDNFIMLTLGTGVGSAIVAGGNIIYGHRGMAGELGHARIRPGRKHWSTGLNGTLESYASATGIVQTALLLLEEGRYQASLLNAIPKECITAQLICEHAMKGDGLCTHVFEFTAELLGEAIANFILFSDPQAVVLFGGVTKAGDLLLSPLRQHMEKNLLPAFKNTVQVMISDLPDSDAAILGSGALVWESIPKN